MMAILKRNLYKKDKKLNVYLVPELVFSFQLIRLSFILKRKIILKCFKRKKTGNIRNKNKNSIFKKTIIWL